MNEIKIFIRAALLLFVFAILFAWFHPDMAIYTPNLPIFTLIFLVIWLITTPSKDR